MTNLLSIERVHTTSVEKTDAEFNPKWSEEDEGVRWKLHGNYIHQQRKRIVLYTNLNPGELSPRVLLLVSKNKGVYLGVRTTTDVTRLNLNIFKQ
jgi:hypothetical protein